MPQRRPNRMVQGRYADLARRWSAGHWIDLDKAELGEAEPVE
ncbi:hypothetical protein AB8O64_29750 [Streptomyces sp. QH1-20]